MKSVILRGAGVLMVGLGLSVVAPNAGSAASLGSLNAGSMSTSQNTTLAVPAAGRNYHSGGGGGGWGGGYHGGGGGWRNYP